MSASRLVPGAGPHTLVRALDASGPDGTNHLYYASWHEGDLFGSVRLPFQHGPIREAGPNGLTNETLLAIVRDRLEGFQRGPLACEENALALIGVCSALDWLDRRTAEREARGVEGTHKP